MRKEKEYIELKAAIKSFDADNQHEYYPFEVISRLRSIPAADVREVKRGKWTDATIWADKLYDRLGMTSAIMGYICDCCQEFCVARYSFCPNCGADMRQKEET